MELILFVGLPASVKTSGYRARFASAPLRLVRMAGEGKREATGAREEAGS